MASHIHDLDAASKFVPPTKNLPRPDSIIPHKPWGKIGRWYPDGWIIVADHMGVEMMPRAGSGSMFGGRIEAVEVIAALCAAHQWHEHYKEACAQYRRNNANS